MSAATVSRSPHLDMLRGLAALLVVIGHVRAFVLVDYAEIAAPGAATKAIYLIGGMGHQAVIVFFALSGYLVGGGAIDAMREGRWLLSRYALARLSRLWIVLAPALALTLAWDALGRAIDPGAYDGAWRALLSSGPSPDAPARSDAATALANVVFLQTILAPPLGSNGPLWSLANEFWYYVAFPPLAALALLRPAPPATLMLLAPTALVAWLAPPGLVALFAIWAAGALAGAGRDADAGPWLRAPAFGLAAGLAALALALLARARGAEAGLVEDIALGLCVALALPGLARAQLPRPGVYVRLATALSNMSYTLYATHFPALFALWALLLAPRQYPPGATAALIAGAALAVALGQAAIVWLLFERNTARWRQALAARLLTPAPNMRRSAGGR